jgi:hypothetical protein
MNKFTAVFERDGDWWIGYVGELPGANTQGRADTGGSMRKPKRCRGNGN